MNAQDCALLFWDVELPERQGASLSSRTKPQGTLVIECEGERERLHLPVAVCRRLKAKRKAGEFEPLTREQLLEGVSQATVYCARMRIERLMNRREYATSEVRAKLYEDGYTRDVVEACVERAVEVGLVSDTRFSDSFIRSKLAAGWGTTRIERELARRGIETDDIAGWPYEFFDPDDELDRAVEIASRRRVIGRNPFEKLVRHLVSRGFSMDISYRAARQVLDERGDENED